MERSKMASYLGFARRAGKLTLGVNASHALKRGVYLLVADPTAQKNSQKELEKLKNKFCCPVVYCEGLGALVGKDTCKLVAVRDEQFARLIARQAEDDKEQS